VGGSEEGGYRKNGACQSLFFSVGWILQGWQAKAIIGKNKGKLKSVFTYFFLRSL
jgi:hypothetical protein